MTQPWPLLLPAALVWCVLATIWLRGLGPATRARWMHQLHAMLPVAVLAGALLLPSGTIWPVTLAVWLRAGAVILVLLTLVWLWTLHMRNSSVMDVVYSTTALLPAAVELALRDARQAAQWILMAMMVVWSARLVRHAGGTNLGARGEQQPYASWRVQHGSRWWWWSYFQVFLLQGGLIWVWVLPVVLAMHAPAGAFGARDLLACALWATGFGFQALADWQLARFKSDPGNRGQVLQTGVWAWSRHPNYFGEALMWWGYFCFGLAHPLGWLGIVGPLYVTWFMSRGSASAMLDRHMLRTRPAAYADYVRRVPGFLPFYKSPGDAALLAWSERRSKAAAGGDGA